MKKYLAKQLLQFEDKCPECNGKMKVVEGFINVGNFFLRCSECGYEFDD